MPEQKEEFIKELSELCKKYNLHGCVFVGENDEDKVIGYCCVERFDIGFSYNHLATATCNAARMYQSAREQLFRYMDKI